MASPSSFVVAIFCALPLESDAVIAQFDSQYHGWQVGRRSRYSYTAGRIGNLDVVVVHLDHIGTVPAASAAGECHALFPSIKLALVVGVCGAVLSYRCDAREVPIDLGDVIVSDRVFHADLGRQHPDGFVAKVSSSDSLARPSPAICSLLHELRTEDCLAQLRKNTAHHVAACEGKRSLKSAPTWSANQRPRQRGQPPAIHIGAFASSNTVVKCAKHRDNLAREAGVIGFEMEGAGVWESFPCLVIKAKCDHADSDKNKKLQRSAALTAAACMKAMLLRHFGRLVSDTLGAVPLRETAPCKPCICDEFSRYLFSAEQLIEKNKPRDARDDFRKARRLIQEWYNIGTCRCRANPAHVFRCYWRAWDGLARCARAMALEKPGDQAQFKRHRQGDYYAQHALEVYKVLSASPSETSSNDGRLLRIGIPPCI